MYRIDCTKPELPLRKPDFGETVLTLSTSNTLELSTTRLTTKPRTSNGNSEISTIVSRESWPPAKTWLQSTRPDEIDKKLMHLISMITSLPQWRIKRHLLTKS